MVSSFIFLSACVENNQQEKSVFVYVSSDFISHGFCSFELLVLVQSVDCMWLKLVGVILGFRETEAVDVVR